MEGGIHSGVHGNSKTMRTCVVVIEAQMAAAAGAKAPQVATAMATNRITVVRVKKTGTYRHLGAQHAHAPHPQNYDTTGAG